MAEEKTKKLSSKVEKLVEEVSKLTVLELSELVEALQDKLGVTPQVAATAVPAGQGVVGGEAQSAAGSEQAAASTNQTVVMTNAGGNKIAVIKALREINQNWGLKEAKDMTEAVPVEILKDAKSEEAKSAADKLKAAGATVELK